MAKYSGMTLNERLVISGQIDAWDTAVAAGDQRRMTAILVDVELTEKQAQETTAAVLADPGRYGYGRRP